MTYQTPITAPGAPRPLAPFSPAVRHDNLVFVSGQIGLDPATGQLVDGLEAQTLQALRNAEAILSGTSLTLSHVLKVTVYLADINDWAALNIIYADRFAVPVLPARTAIQVAALPLGALVEFDIIAAAH